jgi:Protein of unknown function (DUF1194)
VDNSVHQPVITPSSWHESASRCSRLFSFAIASLAAVVIAQFALAPRAWGQTPVDLELVIAVDVSLSMDLEEQRLQRDGYVAAFRDGEIHKAIVSGAHGRIAVTYMEWAGPTSQHVVIPWTILDGASAAGQFADKLESAPITRERLTSISAALSFSGALFASSSVKGIRRVIDVSGDGPNNSGHAVAPIRDEVVASGIVINGLPIMLRLAANSAFDISDLDRYYGSCVIGGDGAFMVPVRHIDEFVTAIRRKLLLEISGLAPSPLRTRPVQALPGDGFGYDCMTGEKQWQWYFDRIPN